MMKPGDRIPAYQIRTPEILRNIRNKVRDMGYKVDHNMGVWDSEVRSLAEFLLLTSDGNLAWATGAYFMDGNEIDVNTILEEENMTKKVMYNVNNIMAAARYVYFENDDVYESVQDAHDHIWNTIKRYAHNKNVGFVGTGGYLVQFSEEPDALYIDVYVDPDLSEESDNQVYAETYL